MSQIKNGILGCMTGQLGGVLVGQENKTKRVLRSYSFPSNIPTTKQVEKRETMKFFSGWEKFLHAPVIQKYWQARRKRGMSLQNVFIQDWFRTIETSTDLRNFFVAKGCLENSKILLAQHKRGNGRILVQWDTNIYRDGQPDDIAVIVWLIQNAGVPDIPACVKGTSDDRKRSDGEKVIWSGFNQPPPAEVIVFLFFVQKKNFMIVSNSVAEYCHQVP